VPRILSSSELGEQTDQYLVASGDWGKGAAVVNRGNPVTH